MYFNHICCLFLSLIQTWQHQFEPDVSIRLEIISSLEIMFYIKLESGKVLIYFLANFCQDLYIKKLLTAFIRNMRTPPDPVTLICAHAHFLLFQTSSATICIVVRKKE